MRYCGREFSEADIERIRSLMASCPGMHRRALSRRFCEEVGWRKADGQPKEMSCRVALLRMQRDGHILLPAPRRAHYPPSKEVQRTLFALPKPACGEARGGLLSLPGAGGERDQRPVERIHRPLSLPGVYGFARGAATLFYQIRGGDPGAFGLWGGGVEDGAEGPLYRLGRRNKGEKPASDRQQCAFSDPSLGALQEPRIEDPLDGGQTHRFRLAGAIPL